MGRSSVWSELPKSAKLGFHRIVKNDVTQGPKRPNITQKMCHEAKCECTVDEPCQPKTCSNDYERVECILGHCHDNCANQRFQKKVYAKTVVREAKEKGRGVYAAEAHPITAHDAPTLSPRHRLTNPRFD
jgi:hypothetical protein